MKLPLAKATENGAQWGKKRRCVATKAEGDSTNKNPTIDTLSKIAKALEIGVDDLIQK